MAGPLETLARIRAMNADLGLAPTAGPGKLEQFTTSAANSLRDLLVYPNVGGDEGEDPATRPDLMALSAKAGMPLPNMLAPAPRPELPEAQTWGDSATRFAGAVLPYVAAGAATAPLAGVGEAAAARLGVGKLGQIAAGQLAQEAAFVPSTIASSDSLGEAAVRTAAGVGLGTLMGRALGGGPKKLAEAVPSPPTAPFSQEAAGRALARIKDNMARGERPNFGDMLEMGLEETDPAIQQLAREARQEALQKSLAAAKYNKTADPEVEKLASQLKAQLEQLDPTHAGIVAESVETLPPMAADRFVKKVANGGFDKARNLAQQIKEYRLNSMLSGFTTINRVMLSNIIGLPFKSMKTAGAAIADVPLAAGRKIAALATGRELPMGARQRFFVEIPAEMYGYARSLPEALKRAGKESRKVRENLAGTGAIPGVAGQIIRTPGRLLGAADSLVHGIGFRGEIYRQAARLASQEGFGTSPTKFLNRVGQILKQQDDVAVRIEQKTAQIARAQQMLEEAPADLSRASHARLNKFLNRSRAEVDALREGSFIQRASDEADRIVLTNRENGKMDEILNMVDRLDENVPLIGAVLPFRRTPANEVREFARSSPAGFLSAPYRAHQMLQQGAPMEAAQGELADKMGQALIGTLAMYRLLHFVNDGYLKVNPFKERQRAERVTEESAGVVPNSVLVGNYSVPVSRLGPIGPMVLAAARMADIKAGEVPPANLVAELEMYTRQLATQGANEAFFDPLAEFFEAAEADGSVQEKWFQGLGATFVPRAISQFNQVVKEPAKPEEAAATGLPEPIANMVVGARRQLPGKGQADLGLFGKPREVQTPILSLALGRSGELGNNPIAAEMVRVGAYHLPPNGLSKQFQATLSKRGVGYTDAEDRLMRQVKGRIQERAVKAVIESPAYANAPDPVKKKLIDYAYSRVSSAVDERTKALKLAKIPLTERALLGS